MTSKQIRILAVVLLVLAGLLAVLAWQVARHQRVPLPTQNAVATHAVVVTTRAVEAGKPLSTDALTVMQLPIDPTGAYQEVARVAGQVPVINLGANVPVLESQLVSGLARQIPEGDRALAVAVDEVVGVGNQVQPGDFVDVFVILRRDNQEIGESQTRLLLSHLRVLAYGSGAVNEAPKAQSEQMMTRREGAKTAVLSVPLEQVSKLAMAQQAGRLILALRNPKDEAMPSEGMFADPPPVLQARAGVPPQAERAPVDRAVAGVSLSGLVGDAAPRSPAPAMRPATLPAAATLTAATPRRQAQDNQQGVEVIRAGKREIE
ncbi:Flp pilus assembly protein CpaB [Cupriavidus pauculus]|uniref:Flp pilus assembly protein CpaB n=1 Tax=Cupriavidus pauculus TaxID=82633 RepID=UPI001248BEBD|nr:Flp pilus assembly protein CpaB [Cupriavidus pauculus]KAB0596864.1 Flp pilus assembly protein CpaB [Cupriavidus pauculus]MCM3607210.1 Flp pilus assembly protein CpaB [Cupriavidus pauculus]UAL01853.1 Flp pilus assembly protein CpaB [Cupriavidus pauculus]